MKEAQAYLNGEFVPASAMRIPATDAGFVLGATVAEQLRTFRGELFRLEEHLSRLEDSLAIIGVAPGVGKEEFASVARELVARNRMQPGAEEELGLSVFVTPGTYAAFAPNADQRPTVGMHTYRLPFGVFAEKYSTGQALVASAVRQVPPACWPAGLKCRSRMHYFLADREAAAQEPGARALLLDLDGYVCEASTANVIAYFRSEGLVSPPLSRVLHGISLDVVCELASSLGLPATFRDLTLEDLADADELMLSSTSPCLLPVTRLGGRPIGPGRPGSVFHRLISAWSELVGTDIVEQAQRLAGCRV